MLRFGDTKVMPVDDLRRHMREEGENLDRLLAGTPTRTPA